MKKFEKTTLETSGEDVKTTLETSGEDVKTTLETSGEDVKTTLETSWEDVPSAVSWVGGRVAPLARSPPRENQNYGHYSAWPRDHAMNWTEPEKTTLETSGEDVKLHSKRVEKMWNYTRNECNLVSIRKSAGSDIAKMCILVTPRFGFSLAL